MRDIAGHVFDWQALFNARSVQHEALLVEDKLRDSEFLSEQPRIRAVDDALGHASDGVSRKYWLLGAR